MYEFKFLNYYGVEKYLNNICFNKDVELNYYMYCNFIQNEDVSIKYEDNRYYLVYNDNRHDELYIGYLSDECKKKVYLINYGG